MQNPSLGVISDYVEAKSKSLTCLSTCKAELCF